jgi:hypothetical protein
MVLSRVAHVLLATALFAAPSAFAQTPSAPPSASPKAHATGQPDRASAATSQTTSSSAIPSLPISADDDSSKDQPSLAERLLTSPREPRCDDDGTIGGIMVCGKKKDNSKDRVPIPNALRAATDMNDGMPRPPDVSGTTKLTGGIKFHGCLWGGCPQQMLPDINFKMIPTAPEGSDADRIAKGEIRAP